MTSMAPRRSHTIRIPRKKALPFGSLVSNPGIDATMREARGRTLPRFRDTDALLKDLKAGG